MSKVDDSAHGMNMLTTPKMEEEEPLVFSVPVDSENKSKVMKPWSFQKPHHLSFQMSWISFFVAFLATFAAAPMLPVIRNDLDLTKQDVSAAGIAAVTGTIGSRIAMGGVCDSLGPRYGHGVLQLSTSAATFAMASVTGAGGFIACRFLIGFSLATFVACQFWCTIMFTPRIVGTANAVAAGWGNLGGGVTNLIMPFILEGFEHIYPAFIAWRVSYFVPGSCQILTGLMVLVFGQDLPEGNYELLKKRGAMARSYPKREFIAAVKNYRTWILILTYGYCFGVELTVDNVAATYLYDQFDVSLNVAGTLAATFGLMNVFARALGGFISDVANKYYGMRGRLWTLWITQTLGGVCSILVWQTQNSLGATMAVYVIWSILVPAACGATFGVAPFITRRGLGYAIGFIGAGGNAGSSITQAAFFTSNSLSEADGFKWMGVMIIGMTALLFLVYFPMWGGMFFPARAGATEEAYYMGDYSAEEQKLGLHKSVMKFANESKSNRGMSMTKAAAAAAQKQEEEAPTNKV